MKELQGKDRITQHLLTLHSLEETLALVTEVVSDVIQLDRVVVYVKRGDRMISVAAVGMDLPDTLLGQELRQVIAPEYEQALSTVQTRLVPINVEQAESPFALVPILQDDTLLGMIMVDSHKTKEPISSTKLRTLSSFALQAAVAIRDAQVNDNAAVWEEQLEEVLELDKEIGQADQLDELKREMDQ